MKFSLFEGEAYRRDVVLFNQKKKGEKDEEEASDDCCLPQRKLLKLNKR